MNLPTKVCLGAGAFLAMSGGLLAVTGAFLGGAVGPDLPFGGSSGSSVETEYVAAEEVLPFTNLEVDLSVGDVTVMAPGEYDLSFGGTRAQEITYEVDGDTLRVTDSGAPERYTSGDGAWVSIYLPDNVKLGTVHVSTAMGDVDIMDLAAGSLSVSSGLGDVYLSNVSAETAALNLSMGDLWAYTLDTADALTVENELGDVWMDGNFQGDTSVTMSMGSLDLGISLGMSDYSLDLEAALGDLYLDGSRQYGAVHREDGENQLTVDSAVGDVSIYFDYGY